MLSVLTIVNINLFMIHNYEKSNFSGKLVNNYNMRGNGMVLEYSSEISN